MLRYLFARLWQNPLARLGTLAALILISFALIFSARQPIYRYLARLFSTPDWSDFAHHGKRPYAFEESEARAQKLTAGGWSAIYELAEQRTGDKHDADGILSAPVGRRPFSAFLKKHAEQEIFTFFNGLHGACGSLKKSMELSDNSSALGEVAESQTPQGKAKHGMVESMRDLLRIHATQVEAALQKKPDYLPAIELAEEVYRATCGMREVASLYARALDYREYYLEKQLHDSDGGKLFERNPEEFHARALESFGRDSFYRELLLRHFQATKYRTPAHPAQLKHLRDRYNQLRNAQALRTLVQALLAEARAGNSITARKCHYELFSLDYPGITGDPEYLHALAETAYRGGEFTRAQNIVMNALKAPTLTDSSLRREFERLRFFLEIERHESENLSRF